MDDKEKMKLFFEIFNPTLHRHGPGDNKSTNKALDIILPLLPAKESPGDPVHINVLDIGCGAGAQTFELARRIDGTILAVDNHKPFLDELMRRAENTGSSDKISILLADMSDMDLEPESFDIIWSEGAISLMGFHRGFEVCYNLLLPGGFIAVTELCWFKPDPPSECYDFFNICYPQMTDVKTNISIIEDCGFKMIDDFKLPKSSWLQEFYEPLESEVSSVRNKYSGEPNKLEFVEFIQKEIDIYRKYSDYYGYTFFIARKK